MSLNTRQGVICSTLVKADLDLMAAQSHLFQIHKVDGDNALLGAGEAMVGIQIAIIRRLVEMGKADGFFEADWSEDRCVVEAYEHVREWV